MIQKGMKRWNDGYKCKSYYLKYSKILQIFPSFGVTSFSIMLMASTIL